MGLTEDLHAAVADPPAPEFDLDHLMQRGRARRATSPTLVGLAACAAVGLIIGGTYAATASRPGGRPLPAARAAVGGAGTADCDTGAADCDVGRADDVLISENASNRHVLPSTDRAVLIAASHLAALSLHP